MAIMKAGFTPLSDETIRRRDIRMKIEWRDLRRLIGQAVMDAAGLTDTLANIEINLKQDERGSPSYRIDEWSAIVKVTVPVD